MAWFAASCLYQVADNAAISLGLQNDRWELKLAALTILLFAFLAKQGICYLLFFDSLPAPKPYRACCVWWVWKSLLRSRFCVSMTAGNGFQMFPQLSPGPASCKLTRFYRNGMTSLPLLPQQLPLEHAQCKPWLWLNYQCAVTGCTYGLWMRFLMSSNSLSLGGGGRGRAQSWRLCPVSSETLACRWACGECSLVWPGRIYWIFFRRASRR